MPNHHIEKRQEDAPERARLDHDTAITPFPWTVESHPDTEGGFIIHEARHEQQIWCDQGYDLSEEEGNRRSLVVALAFSGEFVEFRRHTKGLIYDELEFMAYRAMKKMVSNLTKFQAWHEGLKNFSLTEWDAKILLVEIMTNSIIPPSKFARFSELYFGGVYDPTLWGFHETVTDVLRDSNLLALPKKNRMLNGMLDTYRDVRAIDPPSSLAEFYAQRHLLSRH